MVFHWNGLFVPSLWRSTGTRAVSSVAVAAGEDLTDQSCKLQWGLAARRAGKAAVMCSLAWYLCLDRIISRMQILLLVVLNS